MKLAYNKMKLAWHYVTDGKRRCIHMNMHVYIFLIFIILYNTFDIRLTDFVVYFYAQFGVSSSSNSRDLDVQTDGQTDRNGSIDTASDSDQEYTYSVGSFGCYKVSIPFFNIISGRRV